ncbi:DUF2577 domain-containing protein [Paenibacillus hemerocallicola]|uniref:DUF2577 domain-containing protein n=1 Tax=Paenibacillus hemerocallicola TaxID=1172614 RepID=A0A5C4TGN9_9BACL|nr:DUF2577 domain-containing protein [Paenibacillus hemerocallicola]TNJ68233.1 DUF2577 domain-containing protein [Paenibacillus hemerocallicola]
MLDIIKQAAKEAVEAGSPVNILFGEVIQNDPLEVNVDQRFTLDADFLNVPESLTRYEVDLKHSHTYTDDGASGTTGEALADKIVIRPGLQTGDKVVLLRIQGGQQYLILDKVVVG